MQGIPWMQSHVPTVIKGTSRNQAINDTKMHEVIVEEVENRLLVLLWDWCRRPSWSDSLSHRDWRNDQFERSLPRLVQDTLAGRRPGLFTVEDGDEAG